MFADVPEQPRGIRSTLVAKTEGSGEPLEGLFYIEVAIEEVFQFRLIHNPAGRKVPSPAEVGKLCLAPHSL